MGAALSLNLRVLIGHVARGSENIGLSTVAVARVRSGDVLEETRKAARPASAAVVARYAVGIRADHGRTLDGFTAVTGFHRKHATRVLRTGGTCRFLVRDRAAACMTTPRAGRSSCHGPPMVGTIRHLATSKSTWSRIAGLRPWPAGTLPGTSGPGSDGAKRSMPLPASGCAPMADQRRSILMSRRPGRDAIVGLPDLDRITAHHRPDLAYLAHPVAPARS